MPRRLSLCGCEILPAVAVAGAVASQNQGAADGRGAFAHPTSFVGVLVPMPTLVPVSKTWELTMSKRFDLYFANALGSASAGGHWHTLLRGAN